MEPSSRIQKLASHLLLWINELGHNKDTTKSNIKTIQMFRL
jgi:hypothetical protein